MVVLGCILPELNPAVSSHVNMVYDEQLVSTMGEQRDSTAMNSKTAAIPDISINIGGASLSGIRIQQDQSRSHTCTRGSIHAVRRFPDKTVVVPCSATLVPVSEDIVSDDVYVCCEESEIGVDMSVAPSLSAGLEIVFEQLAW